MNSSWPQTRNSLILVPWLSHSLNLIIIQVSSFSLSVRILDFKLGRESFVLGVLLNFTKVPWDQDFYVTLQVLCYIVPRNAFPYPLGNEPSKSGMMYTLSHYLKSHLPQIDFFYLDSTYKKVYLVTFIWGVN